MADGYAGFDVKQLYAMVDAARQGLAPSRQQIDAWRRTTQMLDQHAAALRGYREQLATRWPPQSNAAAAAYLAELDRLVSAVEQTSRAATASAAQIGYVADEIERTHARLKPVHDEYLANEVKLARYEAAVQAAGTGGRTTQGPVGEFLAEGAMKLFTSPPVDDGRQEALTQQARAAMGPLTGAAQDAIWNIQVPPSYTPPGVDVNSGGTQLGDDSPGGAHRPPPIDPPAHTRANSGSVFGNGGAHHVGPGSTREHIYPQLPDAGTEAGSHGARPPTYQPGTGPFGSGPTLSEVILSPAPVGPPITAVGPALPQPLGGVPVVGDGISVPPAGGDVGAAAKDAGRAAVGTGTGGLMPDRGRASPYGGVIGGQPGQVGRIVDGPVRRVNPVGGVIGSAVGHGVPGVAPGPGGTSQLAMKGGRPGPGRGRRDDESPEVEGAWDVPRGVSPVIDAGYAPGRHDPGLGVIGIDR